MFVYKALQFWLLYCYILTDLFDMFLNFWGGFSINCPIKIHKWGRQSWHLSEGEHGTWHLCLVQFLLFDWPVHMKAFQKLSKTCQCSCQKINSKLWNGNHTKQSTVKALFTSWRKSIPWFSMANFCCCHRDWFLLLIRKLFNSILLLFSFSELWSSGTLTDRFIPREW